MGEIPVGHETWQPHELEGAMMMWRRGVMAASRMGMGRGRRMFSVKLYGVYRVKWEL